MCEHRSEREEMARSVVCGSGLAPWEIWRVVNDAERVVECRGECMTRGAARFLVLMEGLRLCSKSGRREGPSTSIFHLSFVR